MNENDRKVLNELLDRALIRIKSKTITQEEHPEIYQKIVTLMTYLRKPNAKD